MAVEITIPRPAPNPKLRSLNTRESEIVDAIRAIESQLGELSVYAHKKDTPHEGRVHATLTMTDLDHELQELRRELTGIQDAIHNALSEIFPTDIDILDDDEEEDPDDDATEIIYEEPGEAVLVDEWQD
jgi:hypothetical protein